MPKRKITVDKVRALLKEADKAIQRQKKRHHMAKREKTRSSAVEIIHAINQRMWGLAQASVAELHATKDPVQGMLYIFNTSSVYTPLATPLVEREYSLLKKAIARKK